MEQVIVVGGGAAGMMAALQASKEGRRVILIEKNEKLGKKIYITGKGRCNLTNACEIEALFPQVMRNAKFLYSAFYTFSNGQTIDFFEQHGCPTKTERGMRVFPCSDHASDVTRVLQKLLRQAQVEVRLQQTVQEILKKEHRVTGVRLENGEVIASDAVIVATGGCSYPTTGSTGDGYRFARMLGHSVIEPQPALVPFETAESWAKELQGLSLKNVRITLVRGKKQLYEAFGELLFTHFGVSGPLLLSASSAIADCPNCLPLQLYMDLKPALSEEAADRAILRDFEESSNKTFKNVIQKRFPSRLIPVMIQLSGIDGETKVHEITRAQRQEFVRLMKRVPLTLNAMRGFSEAIITRGGVCVREINPSTMESKLVSGLYFAGEVLDVDAQTGGFNLQIAWSTGYLAGESVSGAKEGA